MCVIFCVVPLLFLLPKIVMPGATENAALLFLLITSSLLPVLYERYLQQERKKRNDCIEEYKSIALVAEMTLRVRRQLVTGGTPGNEEDNEGRRGRRKRLRSSRFKHDRAKRAIPHEDYFAPTPVFNDRQFERIFRVSKSFVQELFDTCARSYPFFTIQRDVR